MSNKVYTITEIREKIKTILDDTDVVRTILFGSYAKNMANCNSDIDLVIDSNGKLKGFKLYSLISKIEELFQKDVDAFEQFEIIEKSELSNNINKEGIIIYEK